MLTLKTKYAHIRNSRHMIRSKKQEYDHQVETTNLTSPMTKTGIDEKFTKVLDELEHNLKHGKHVDYRQFKDFKDTLGAILRGNYSNK